MNDPREVSRAAAAAMGVEAVAITAAGRYTAPSGAVVDIAPWVERAVEDTTEHPPEERIPLPPPGAHATRITVTNETTLAAARRLLDAGRTPVALNFASGRNPGGGFLTGARAQEESLCRASALHACLKGSAMYGRHAALDDPLYTSWLVYSPCVPVFRDDDGALLERPWRCSFVTAPAPNAKALRKTSPERLHEVPAAFEERIRRVLAVAAREGHDAVVLGAWGCGAFGCDADMVAGRFRAALDGEFRGAFEEAVFAVLDASPEGRFIGPFERAFGGA